MKHKWKLYREVQTAHDFTMKYSICLKCGLLAFLFCDKLVVASGDKTWALKEADSVDCKDVMIRGIIQ